MLDLKGLAKTYPLADRMVPAVRNVDLTIREGEFVSIVGHSGSGKSTLLGLMGGISRPDAGTVLMDGNDIWKYNDRDLSRLRNGIFGFVYQFASLIPTLTARENILLPSLFGRKRPREDALPLLEQVGLGGMAERYSSELSGGEQQRVAIARAFINNPRIVLADEPTGDLDEETEASIMDFFERMNRDRKVAVVMVTHSSELARRATRRLRMKQGMLEVAG
ncbi:MAG TPA: ABC transporter ATP-binding protein [Nitrospirota bacterium]|nr:ABC transporter ATP-binding protein [Nitrospirota bacterium]